MEKPNLDFVLKLSDGDVEFKNKLISILKKEFLVEVNIYNDSYSNKSFTSAAEIVHKLKHKISLLGLKESFEFTNSYESELKNQNFSKHESFQLILNEISVFLNDL
jgi:hypothetical protein